MMNQTSEFGPLRGQSAIVTGASSGIGAAIARAIAGAGATVAINWSRGEEAARRVLAEITAAGGRGITVGGDVSREEDVTRMFRATVAEFGGVDILVNNAGMQRDAAFADMVTYNGGRTLTCLA